MSSLSKLIKKSNKIVAISNYKCLKEIEEFVKDYDLVIRFNNGSNELTLKEKLKDNFSNRNDVCVLSGWDKGNFGDLNGFKEKTILFSRPKCTENIKYYYKEICVKQNFEDVLKKYTQKINYIHLQVFYDFYHEYNYDNPTTGLITIYCINKYFKKSIDVINFFCSPQDTILSNAFLTAQYISKYKVSYHQLSLESSILDKLNVERIEI